MGSGKWKHNKKRKSSFSGFQFSNQLSVMPWTPEEEDTKVGVWDNVSGAASALTGALFPSSLRRKLKSVSKKVVDYSGTGIVYVGKAAWVVTTAALVLLLPLAMEVDREQALVEMEQEAMRVRELLAGSPALM
jgi:hypothetical protein